MPFSGRGGYNHQDRDNDFRRDGRDGRDNRDGDRYPRRHNANNGYEDRNNREGGAGGEEAPRERPKLNLAPRTLPMPELKVDEKEMKKEEEPIEKAPEVVEPPPPPRPKPTPVPSATIFGSAKPVDTAAKEREIEERLEKQRMLEEERERERQEKAAAEESSEKEPEVVANDNEVNSWRRRDNERDADDIPRMQSPPRNRRYSPDRRGGRKYGTFASGRVSLKLKVEISFQMIGEVPAGITETEITEKIIGITETNATKGKSKSTNYSSAFHYSDTIPWLIIRFRGDRNRGDNYNRGGNRNDRNEITRSRDDNNKPSRRDKSAGDSKDFDRMPKYQAPVKPVSKFDVC